MHVRVYHPFQLPFGIWLTTHSLYCSVVILPSATGERKAEAAMPSSPVITLPVVSQSFRCVENFETHDTKNRPFKATKEETLEVLMKDRTGRAP